jgi:tRNA pseudouridine55 synthase
MLYGILPVHKPTGIGSFDVIRQLKKILPKNQKIGHGGTLDNLASGVLPILLGEATKAFDFLLLSDKIYAAEIQFGALSETDDAEGKIIRKFDKKISLSEIEFILEKFRGKILQTPPRFSAIRINGQRSYDLARNNKETPLQPREVEIHDTKIEKFIEDEQKLLITIHCSSGTYIRSIARDMGTLLQTGGYLSALVRLKSAGIYLEDCCYLEGLTDQNIESFLLNLNQSLALPELSFMLQSSYIKNGRPLEDQLFKEAAKTSGIYKITQDNRLLAIVEKKGNKYYYLRVFNE